MDVLVSLGPHTFYAVHPSFERFKNRLTIDWRSQRRLSRRPAEQFIGPGDEVVKFDGVLYPERFGNGRSFIEGLRASALNGDRLPLIEIASGTLIGSMLGEFVIIGVDHDKEHYGVAGAKKIHFRLGLKAYGPDGDGFTGGLF